MMLQVLAALVPAALAHVWYFGPGFIFNLLVAGIFAVAGEAFVMWLRNRPAESALTDYSAPVAVTHQGVSDGTANASSAAVTSAL